jgi:hypothetical protein
LVSTCGITNKILIEYDYFFWYITWYQEEMILVNEIYIWNVEA